MIDGFTSIRKIKREQRENETGFVDIIGVQWQAFRTERQTRDQLKEAGFTDMTMMYDSQGMFPTVIARK